MELGYSFCPNDTFIFYALTHGKVPSPVPVREVLEDVETLNRWAFAGRLPLTKISYAAFAHLRETYVALRSGGALGRGVGPLLVAREAFEDLTGKRIAHPGRYTTAYLLLRMFAQGQPFEAVEFRYDRILPALQRGEVDAGLLIHESRFVYPRYGLVPIVDLGAWWEAETGLPLPLGAILARRDLGEERIRALDQAVRASLEYARAHPDEPWAYIKRHAQELEDAVIHKHIATYVNAFSLDVGAEGEAAVRELFRRAEALELVPRHEASPFLPRSAGKPV